MSRAPEKQKKTAAYAANTIAAPVPRAPRRSGRAPFEGCLPGAAFPPVIKKEVL